MCLIDAGKTMQRMKDTLEHCLSMDMSLYNATDTILAVINNSPEVDAEPVRHGKWIWENKMMGGDFYRCSECGEVEFVEKILTPPTHCHCGAKMDK